MNGDFIDNVRSLNSASQARERALRGIQKAPQQPRRATNTSRVSRYTQRAVSDELAKVKSAPGGTRNQQLYNSACNIFELVKAGQYDKDTAWRELTDAACDCGLDTDHKDGAMRQVEKSLDSAWKKVGARTIPVLNSFRAETEPAQSVSINDFTDLEDGFWDSRDSLRDVYIAALSRMSAPWAVLANCVARALAVVRPNTVLPPLIGGKGSLNWFAAVAASSGGGKGSASAVAQYMVNVPVFQRNLGSGEGIVQAYRQSSADEELRESVMFVADEVDTIGALGNRVGSTLMSVLRSGFSGETLGFSYVTRNALHIEAHTYRMTLVVSVQPTRAESLDSRGGTLQRFMWFPGTDPRIEAQAPLMPGPLSLPAMTEWQYPRQLQIPAKAEQMIRRERARNMRGETGALDGHSLFIREKFAYGLALLDSRAQMNDADWDLAAIAMNISNFTRQAVMASLDEARQADSEDRGRHLGITQNAATEEKSYREIMRSNRIARWAVMQLKAAGAVGMNTRELTQAIAARDRRWLMPIVDSLTERATFRAEGDGYGKRWYYNC